jgi:hypothetical protein
VIVDRADPCRAKVQRRGLRTGASHPALSDVVLSPEVTRFVVLHMRNEPDVPYEDQLTALARSATVAAGTRNLEGNALTLLHGLTGRLEATDWSGLNLDFAHLDGADPDGRRFARSSLRFASLENTSLNNADFREADLTGCRLGETAPVRALTAGPPGCVLSAHADGTLREWRTDGGTTRTLIADLPGGTRTILTGPPGTVAAVGDQVVSIHVSTTGGWRCVSTFTRRADLRALRSLGYDLLLVLDDRAVHYSTTARAAIDELQVSGVDTTTIAPDAGLLPRVRGETGVVTVLSDTEERWVPLDGVAALDVRTGPDGAALIVAGHHDGRVSLVPTKRSAGKPPVIGMPVPHAVHDGMVTAVCLVGDSLLATAGMDRALQLFAIGEGYRLAFVRRVTLSARGNGMRLDGVRGPREAALLQMINEQPPA